MHLTNAEGRAAGKPGKQAQSFVEITDKMDGAKAARPVPNPESKRQRNRPYVVRVEREDMKQGLVVQQTAAGKFRI